MALTALSRNKEWEKIDKYLECMGDIALDTGGEMTGNKAVDALLCQKKQAEEAGIRWECDIQIPRECRINEQEHGIGLLNVGDVVHGYDGVWNAEAENGIFLISVLMPFPDAAHGIKKAV